MLDPLRMTIAYLRLWKACDFQLSRAAKQDSARMFELIPMDEHKITKDLKQLLASDLSWSEKPQELRADLQTVLDLSEKSTRNEKELAALRVLRAKFQQYALNYSGDIKLAMGGSATAAL